MNSKPRKIQKKMNLRMHSDGSAPKFLEGACIIERNEKMCQNNGKKIVAMCKKFWT